MVNNKLIVAGVLGLTALASVAPAAFADGRDGDRGAVAQYQNRDFRGGDRDQRFDGRDARFDRDGRDGRDGFRRDGDDHNDAALGLVAGLVLGALASR